MLTSSAALGLPGVLFRPLGKEYGWDTEQISSALALRFALYGLMGPFAVILMDRFGLRKVICTALVLVTAGMALTTRIVRSVPDDRRKACRYTTRCSRAPVTLLSFTVY